MATTLSASTQQDDQADTLQRQVPEKGTGKKGTQ